MDIIDTAPARTVVLTQQQQVEITRHRAEVVRASSPGVQGPRGPAGVDASGALPVVNFAFGDASPRAIITVPGAGQREITGVSVQIDEAFDGIGASLAIGTADDPGALAPAVDGMAAIAGIYEFTPRTAIAAGEDIILTINPGAGATRGQGQIVINAVQL